MKRQLSLFLTGLLCFFMTSCGQDAQHAAPVQIDRDSAIVSYLGPVGTYTQEACGVFFENQGSYIPYVTVKDAVDALISGDSHYAVIPQENTIGGAVIDYVDTLIAYTDVSVVGEVELPINQNLLALPDAGLNDIKKVYSHSQGITQGKAWLEEHIPHAEVIEVSSTAEGAIMVSESQDPSCAAIASAACADVYGLQILGAAIQNNDSNKTRFYVLSLNEPATAQGERLAFVAMGDAAALPSLMAKMEKLDMTLVAIHDRPLKTELGQYFYLIECMDCNYGDYLKLTEMNELEFRYLGSFELR